jgi:RHS repeat-associated protein
VVLLYDDEGEAVGFYVHEEPQPSANSGYHAVTLPAQTDFVYTYVKNLQGDVIRILDSDGNAVVKYTYDPWGVPTVYGDSELAAINPCSYRGYYYDEETGYYYLQSRYYDPKIGRFLNSDAIESLGSAYSIQCFNFFAYCYNTPTSYFDPDGHSPLQWAMAIIGGVAGWLFGDYVARKLGYSSGWKYWTIRAGVVIGGAVLGWFIGTAITKIATKFLLTNPKVLAQMPRAVLILLGIDPQIGSKLNYIFGQATGNAHNVARSLQMLKQLEKIGIHDTSYWRNYVQQVITDMFYSPVGAYVQGNGRIVKETLLWGPFGALKIRTVWEGVKLITIELFG